MNHQEVPAVDHNRFGGIERLYGRGSLERLARARVCVVGVGGVGSWVVEALARSGVGHLSLIDADDVCLSNSNRQLHALDGNFGQPKVEVLARRAVAIFPGIQVAAIPEFLTVASLERHLLQEFDLVVDACDSFRVKVEAIAFCRRRRVPLITVGSAGGRTDPTKILIRDLSRTEHDALLALVRKKLRADFGFPRNTKRSFGVPAVFSLENVRYPQADGSVCGLRPVLEPDAALRLDCGQGLGAATHVTAAFGFAAAARGLQRLLAQA
jgi:tRNA A37 threonylcarbamoyladenosine dehydratase